MLAGTRRQKQKLQLSFSAPILFALLGDDGINGIFIEYALTFKRSLYIIKLK